MKELFYICWFIAECWMESVLNLNFTCSLLLFEFPVFSLTQVISHFFLVKNTSGEISLNETMKFLKMCISVSRFLLNFNPSFFLHDSLFFAFLYYSRASFCDHFLLMTTFFKIAVILKQGMN